MSQIILPAYNWQPMQHQQKAWAAMEQGKKRTVLAWHRRAGKDELALHNAAIKAMQRVGNYWHMLPMQEQARRALWEGVNPKTGRRRWQDAFPSEIIEHVDNQTMRIRFKNGSTWQLLGSDNYNSLVGSSAVGITYSEAALCDPNAYAFFNPMLLENDGWAVFISSVRGKNFFYRLFKELENNSEAFVERLSAEDTNVFTPLNLAMERSTLISLYGDALGNATFEQEYLSVWESAIIGSIFGSELRALKEEGRALPLAYDPRFPVQTSWDIGVSDPTVILFWQNIGNYVNLIDWYSSTDTGLEHYAEVLASKPYYYNFHYGPHDVTAREWSNGGVSRMDAAKLLGLKFERGLKLAKGDSIAAGSSLIKRMRINVSDKPVTDRLDDCSFVLEALEQYRFTFDEKTKVMSANPVHDWTSHYADAFMEKAVHEARIPRNQQRTQALQGRTENPLNRFDNRKLSSILANLDKPKGPGGAFSK